MLIRLYGSMYYNTQMRYLLSILLLSGILPVQSQTEAVFNVKAKAGIYLVPDVDTLMSGVKYLFKIKGIEQGKIAQVRLPGGNATVTDSGIVVSINNSISETKKYSLQLLAKNNNLLRVVYQKEIVVPASAGIPRIQTSFFANRQRDIGLYGNAFLMGNVFTVSKDSACILINNIFSNVTAKSMSNSPFSTLLSVDFNCNGHSETDTNDSLKLTKVMVDKISEMASGCYILLKARYHSASDPPDDAALGPYRITLK